MAQLTNHLLSAATYSITGSGIAPGTNSTATLEKIISTVLGVLTVVGVIYFVVQVILAGFNLISSKGDPKEFKEASNRLVHNLIGLFIVIIAYGFTVFITGLLGISNVFDLKNSLPTM